MLHLLPGGLSAVANESQAQEGKLLAFAAQLACGKLSRRCATILHHWHKVAARAKLSLQAWSRWWRLRMLAAIRAWRAHVVWKAHCTRRIARCTALRKARLLRSWQKLCQDISSANRVAAQMALAKRTILQERAFMSWMSCVRQSRSKHVLATRHGDRCQQWRTWGAWKRLVVSRCSIVTTCRIKRGVGVLLAWLRVVRLPPIQT